MTTEIHDPVPASCQLLAVGEATHLESSFALSRNDLFPHLASLGFRSIALETDRIAALTVDDFVRKGQGDLGTAMAQGFSHNYQSSVEGFTLGASDVNRRLVAWMREHNEGRPAAERLAFYGFDAPMELFSAPSPRRYLEHARDYLGLTDDLAALLGDDATWSRGEALMDPAASPGATEGAMRARVAADDMVTALYAGAPELIAATSREAWVRARAYLRAGIGLLRYHALAALPLEREPRWTRMCAARDALMAENLLEIRDLESPRGPTLVFAHNTHLQRDRSHMTMGDMEIDWYSAGSIVSSLMDDRYVLRLGEPGGDA
ncbi:MAG TPA: erythromycin esterase family protein [Stackebrandtia sp.]|jgi:erythromycin esterase-like protein|uniref:erythromycin esterase family protein n=1 Tax=Stackebrandtia sp. TaxID=2023065 RepID=UPI002D284143|nr:erythromycin esterase family protein [Stackebrandtia sp.]HZE40551.1 erythromycin esterase family protein [Stackebrandtia sp.]